MRYDQRCSVPILIQYYHYYCYYENITRHYNQQRCSRRACERVFVYTPVICAKHARCLVLGANTSQWVRPSSYFPGAVSNIYGALKVAVHARMNLRFSHRAELRAKFQLSVFRVRGGSPSKSHNNRNLTDRFPFKRRGCSFSFGSVIQYYCTPVKAYAFFLLRLLRIPRILYNRKV